MAVTLSFRSKMWFRLQARHRRPLGPLRSVLLAAGGPVWAAASGRPASLAPKGHRGGGGNRVGPSRESEQLRAACPLPAPGGRVSSLSPLAQRPEDAGPVQIRAWLPGRA